MSRRSCVLPRVIPAARCCYLSGKAGFIPSARRYLSDKTGDIGAQLNRDGSVWSGPVGHGQNRRLSRWAELVEKGWVRGQKKLEIYDLKAIRDINEIRIKDLEKNGVTERREVAYVVC